MISEQKLKKSGRFLLPGKHILKTSGNDQPNRFAVSVESSYFNGDKNICL